MKKHIITEQIKKFNLIQKLVYLSPIIILILGIPGIIRRYSLINNYNNPHLKYNYYIVAFTCFIGFYIIILFIALTIIKYKRLDVIKNSTFDSISGLEYHRDKLEGLSPVEISFLTNLELEEKKDISAQILQYELWDIIEYTDNNIIIKNIDDPRLNKRDKVLINLLKNKATDFSTWKDQSYQDMTESKYFNMSKDGKSKFVKVTNFLTTISFIAFIIFFAIFSTSYIKQGENFMEVFDKFTSIKELSKINITTTQLNLILVSILLSSLIFGSFISGLAVSIFDYVNNVVKNKLIRTSEGNKITEYIYGLKNFINDFTLLSEREKKELVLWDDFLIYAVVLEENEKIIDEIFSYRDEKSLLSTFDKVKSFL